MLCRMISRACSLPWKVPVPTTAIPLITESSWVIGVHQVWTDLNDVDATRVGLTRPMKSHRESLERFGMAYELWIDLIQSLPPEETVNYEELVQGDARELGRLREITGISGIVPEPRDRRFAGPFDWCRDSS